MIPKYPSAQELMGMVQMAIDVGKLSLDVGREIMDWMREEDAKRQIREAEARHAKDQADLKTFLEPRLHAPTYAYPELDFSSVESLVASIHARRSEPQLDLSALFTTPSWMNYCRALTRAGSQCARRPGMESIYCHSHKPDGRCHGVTAQGDRCRRETDDYACSFHLATVTVLKA